MKSSLPSNLVLGALSDKKIEAYELAGKYGPRAQELAECRVLKRKLLKETKARKKKSSRRTLKPKPTPSPPASSLDLSKLLSL